MKDPVHMLHSLNPKGHAKDHGLVTFQDQPKLQTRGTRTTVFTNIASVSFQSLEAAAAKKTLASYFKVRVEPSEVNITDYEMGTARTQTVSIKNYSSIVKQVVLQPLYSKQFTLAKGTRFEAISIAPGLSTEVTIHFTSTESKSGKRPESFSDVLEILVKESNKLDHLLKVPLLARIAVPQLEHEGVLDFGVIVSGKFKECDRGRILASKPFLIRNVGHAGVTLNLEYDRSLFRIEPDCIQLGPINQSPVDGSNERELCVNLLASPVGNYSKHVSFHSADFPKSLKPKTASFLAAIVDHKLRFKHSETKQELDPLRIEFVSLYYSQTATFTAILENRDSKPLKWVIMHAGESCPRVPQGSFALDKHNKRVKTPGLGVLPKLQSTDADADESAAKASITVDPMEGNLDPFTSSLITFRFSPVDKMQATGFKCHMTEPSSTVYKMPLQLKIQSNNDTLSGSAEYGEEPIAMSLSGRACPVLVEVSSKEISFPALHLGTEELHKEAVITLKNKSSELGLSFKLGTLAQFHSEPSCGTLTAGESTKIKIQFKPHQLGHFERILNIDVNPVSRVMASDNAQSFEASEVEGDSSRKTNLRRLQLKLKGSLKPEKTSIPSKPSCSPAAEDQVDSTRRLSSTNPDAKKMSNQWAEKMDNCQKYWAYLKSSRIQRLLDGRLKRVGKDGVQVSYDTLLHEDVRVDSENGLLPPEPVDFEISDTEKKNIQLFNQRGETDATKMKHLFQQLMTMEPVPSFSIAEEYVGELNLQTHLSPEEVSNIYTSSNDIDFGTVSIHSINTIPLKFLYASTLESPVCISVLSEGSDIAITPKTILLSPMTVVAISISFTSETPGPHSGKITYLVNGRYRYQIATEAFVKPLSLELSTTVVQLEVSANQSAEVPADGSAAESSIYRPINPSHQAETVIHIKNDGNYSTAFEWIIDHPQTFTSNGIAIEGEFKIIPSSGVIDSFSTANAAIIYTAGIKSFCEKVATLNVVDPKTGQICETIKVQCRGDIAPAMCVVMNSLKQGPLDIGVCHIGYRLGDKRHAMNILASQFLIPSEGQDPSRRYTLHSSKVDREPTSAGFGRGSKTIKIKNTGQKACFFFAKAVSQSSCVTVSPTNGTIQPDGGIMDIHVAVLPTQYGVIEDEIHIFIIGGGKILKVPFKYEGRKPDVSVALKNDLDLAKGTIIGSESLVEVDVVNRGDVQSRVVVDFRNRPEFTFVLRNSAFPPSSARTHSSMSKRAKSPVQRGMINSEALVSHRLKCFKSGHDVFKAFSNASDPLSDTDGSLYVFDVYPGETINCVLGFRPTLEKRINFMLPIHVIGSETKCDGFITAFGIKSPMHLSKSTVNFKNKVVLKDTSTVGVSLLKSTLKESTTISNNSDKKIQWAFDLDSLEEVDNVFKIEPFHGSLNPGSSQNITLSFHPESIGFFESKIPLHIDYLGRQAPFELELRGTGVEPSIAFDPPEVFLPIVPIGQDSVSTFSIVNYGCERTEIKYLILSDTIHRHGRLEVQFPEGKLLKNDGEKLPVVIRFISNPTQPPDTSNSASLNHLPKANSSSQVSKKGKLGSVPALSSNAKKVSKTLKTASNQSVECTEEDAAILPPIYGAPLSFTLKLEFSDSVRTFLLPVHGTLDSSILTIGSYMFSKRNAGASLSEGAGGHLFFNTKKEQLTREEIHRRYVIQTHQPAQSPSGLLLDAPDLSTALTYLDKTLETLIKWISDHCDCSLDTNNVAIQMSRSNGKLLLDLIQSLSCKKKSGMAVVAARVASISTVDRVKLLHKLYSDCLVSLTASGALLSCVKPQHLMTLEDFKVFASIQIEKMSESCGASVHDELIESQKRVEMNFDAVSKEAWILVFSQIIRVYCLQVITTKHFRNLRGVGSDEAELRWPSISKGNIYSTGEVLLLRWASYHMWKRTGQLTRLINFASDFKHGLPIAHLMISHIPELEATVFANFDFACTSREHFETNIRIINAALKELYKTSNYALPIQSVVDGDDSLEVMLLLLFLFQTLPQFIPKGTVEFHGPLHQTITQEIELINPSSRALSYSSILVGSKEFEIHDTVPLTLGPRGQSKVAIEFCSRFSKPSKCQLRLTSKKMSLNNASILIFQLSATVDEPAPKKVYTLDAQMYCSPVSLIGVELTNPFKARGNFSVSLKLMSVLQPLLVPCKGQPDAELPIVESSDEFKHINPPAFRTHVTCISLEPLQTLVLPITFQPFEPGFHRCTIHLMDEAVGEFQYQVEGRAKIPQSVDLLWTCRAGNTLEKSIRVTPVNLARDKALQKVLQDEVSGKARHSVKSKSKNAFVGIDREKFQLPRQMLRYKVDYLSPFFKGPSELLLKPSRDSFKEKKLTYNLEQNYTELHVSFSPKAPGKYSCKVVMTCLDVPDVRVFKIHGVAISEGTRADLDFKTPARQPLTQEIPIVNRTDEEWTVTASIDGQYFSGASVIIAKPRQTTYYSLIFCPTKSGETHGALTLSNSQTSQKYIYNLRGTGQEPLPEENRQIECVARETISETFKVHNFSATDAIFDIVTDLPNPTHDSSLFISANSTVDCVITFRHVKVGASVKIVTFVNRSDQTYSWFILGVNVIPPPSLETIVLSTFVRQALATDIILTNPLDRPVCYEVQMEGEGILAPDRVMIDANAETAYTFTYAPLISCKAKGSLVFTNADVGEFWYELDLDAQDAPPVNVPEMRAPLGKCAAQPLFIENPTNSNAVVVLNVTHSQDFQLMYPPVSSLKTVRRHRHGAANWGLMQILLKPLERAEIQVIFWPSSLTQLSVGSIKATSSQIGNFHFSIQGRGLMPEPMTDVTVRSPLRKSTNSVISFTNPLMDPLPVTVKIAEEDVKLLVNATGGPGFSLSNSQLKVENEFSLLLLRKPKYHVAGLDTLDIPFTYTPQRMVGRAATIVVEMGQLRWMYPIMGLPDAPLVPTPKIFECRSRESLKCSHEVVLSEFNYDVEENFQAKSVSDWANALAFELEVLTAANGLSKENAKNSLKFELVDFRTLEDGLALKFSVLFNPIKPGTATAMLSVHQMSTGGRWRFPISLTSFLPLVDDVIVIEGAINKLSAVSFKIKNSSLEPRPFKAFFMNPSPPELSVAPTQGTLWPENVKGEGNNMFVVGYRALSYGKPIVSTLVIECDDVSWSYEVRGTTPQTRMLSAERKAGLLPSLEPATRLAVKKHKNFIRENASANLK
ncbi:Cilia- and flagella-associated protein 47 [Chytriomyces hyalinus]|nr:Cilia- and flagella-associated protein 47 [Chytriomyces hyalinus]